MKKMLVLTALTAAGLTVSLPALAKPAPVGEAAHGPVRLYGTDGCLTWSSLKNGAAVNVGTCQGEKGDRQQQWNLGRVYASGEISPAGDAGAGLWLAASGRGSANAALSDSLTGISYREADGGRAYGICLLGSGCLSSTTRGSWTLATWQPWGKKRWIQEWELPAFTRALPPQG